MVIVGRIPITGYSQLPIRRVAIGFSNKSTLQQSLDVGNLFDPQEVDAAARIAGHKDRDI